MVKYYYISAKCKVIGNPSLYLPKFQGDVLESGVGAGGICWLASLVVSWLQGFYFILQ